MDKLDGRIPEAFWQKKDLEWRTREQEILIDAVSLYPTYRKPFDLIFKAAKGNEWWT